MHRRVIILLTFWQALQPCILDVVLEGHIIAFVIKEAGFALLPQVEGLYGNPTVVPEPCTSGGTTHMPSNHIRSSRLATPQELNEDSAAVTESSAYYTSFSRRWLIRCVIR